MYKFDFESILQHKIFIEKTLERELAVLKQDLFDEKEKLNINIKEREKHMIDFEQKQRDGISASNSFLYQNFFDRLSKELKLQRKQVGNLENKVGRKNNDLIEAMKKRKILDKLKQKGLQLYMKRLVKKEQKFVDEVSINNYIRNV